MTRSLALRRITFAAASLALAALALFAPRLRAEDQQTRDELKSEDAQKPMIPLPGQAKPSTGAHPVSGRKFAPVMGVGGASWLERGDRDEVEKPEAVIAAMELKETDRVADVGCGTGYFTRRIAKVVPKGKVYANDIQKAMLELMDNYIKKEGVDNVVPILGEPDDPKLPKAGVDWILMVDVYHEFQAPQKMLAHLLDSLAPGGRVMLIEYRGDGDTAKHIKAEHRMTIKQVLSEWNPAGFELEDLNEALPSQRMFIFHRRPDYGPAPKP